MEPVTLGKRGRFIFLLALTALVVGVKMLSPEALERLEWKFQDILYEFKSAADDSKDVVIVNIDDLSIRELGKWPWKEEVFADLIAAVGTAKPQTVLIDFPLPDYAGDNVADSGGIADQLFWMKNVIVSYAVVPTEETEDTVTNPKYLFRNALVTNSDLGMLGPKQALPVSALALPDSSIADAAKRLGFIYSTVDIDHTLRSAPMVMNYQGYYYPSTPLAAASHFLHILPEHITIHGGSDIELGERMIPTNKLGEMHLNFPAGAGFTILSASDILNERANFEDLTEKLVIISLGAGAQTEFYRTPVADEAPRYLLTAIAIDNILQKNYLRRADSQFGWYILALALIGLISAYSLQKISSIYRVIVVAVGLIALANVNFFLFNTFNLMANSIYVALLLVLFLVASPLLSIDYSFLPFLRPKLEDDEDEAEAQRNIETRTAVANAVKTMPRRYAVTKQAPTPANTAANQTMGMNSTIAAIGAQDGSNTVTLTSAIAANATLHGNAGANSKTMVIDGSDLSASRTMMSGPPPSTPPPANEKLAESIGSTGAENSKKSKNSVSSEDSESLAEANVEEATMFGDLTSAVVDSPLDDLAQPVENAEPMQPAEIPLDPGAISLDEKPAPKAAPAPKESVEPTPVIVSTPALVSSGDIKQLGRYQINGILGKGAMGLVYGGIDPAINRKVALKTIRLDFLSNPEEMDEMKERLFLEAQAAGKLNHPNIVTIYDVGSEGAMQYIAMELIEGQTLEDMIKRGVNFNFKIVARMIYQICQALQYAHDAGIVHRDIKPANLMVLPDYSVKVMDFGIARVESSSMTKTGVAMGTPNYISPEQLQGQKIDGRADLFSLGIVFYEMLVGNRPFKGDNLTSLIYSIVNTEPELPSRENPRIPPLFDHIVSKSLKKDPAERYQRASDISAALSDFVQSFSTH